MQTRKTTRVWGRGGRRPATTFKKESSHSGHIDMQIDNIRAAPPHRLGPLPIPLERNKQTAVAVIVLPTVTSGSCQTSSTVHTGTQRNNATVEPVKIKPRLINGIIYVGQFLLAFLNREKCRNGISSLISCAWRPTYHTCVSSNETKPRRDSRFRIASTLNAAFPNRVQCLADVQVVAVSTSDGGFNPKCCFPAGFFFFLNPAVQIQSDNSCVVFSASAYKPQV